LSILHQGLECRGHRLSIRGIVDSVKSDNFILDYGNGVIKVEIDDGDQDADDYKLVAGDKVTPNGITMKVFHLVSVANLSGHRYPFSERPHLGRSLVVLERKSS